MALWRRRPWLLALVVWPALQSGDVKAQTHAEPPAAPDYCALCVGPEQHSGVYLRLALGLTNMELHNAFGSDSELGGTFSFALGYFVVGKLAVSLEASGANAYSFSMPVDAEGTRREVDARSIALGVALTYYFPLEFFISIGPAVGWFQANIKDQASHVDAARFALDLLAGKEWWIGGSWALGAAAQLIYNGAAESVVDVDYTWSLGVLFTVTRN